MFYFEILRLKNGIKAGHLQGEQISGAKMDIFLELKSYHLANYFFANS